MWFMIRLHGSQVKDSMQGKGSQSQRAPEAMFPGFFQEVI
jgi:hypothetical protein